MSLFVVPWGGRAACPVDGRVAAYAVQAYHWGEVPARDKYMRDKPLVLVVDDDRDYREVIGTKLKASGFDVAEAEDGEAGYRRAVELIPDLILMDVKMPRMNGIESLVEIRKAEATKDAKVIFLTAFGDTQAEIYQSDQRFAKQVGAFDYVVKTQDLDQVVAKVRAALGR